MELERIKELVEIAYCPYKCRVSPGLVKSCHKQFTAIALRLGYNQSQVSKFLNSTRATEHLAMKAHLGYMKHYSDYRDKFNNTLKFVLEYAEKEKEEGEEQKLSDTKIWC